MLGHLRERAFVELRQRGFVLMGALPVGDVLARPILDIRYPERLLVGKLLDGHQIIELWMVVLAQPLHRPPAPDAGNDLVIMLWVVAQSPDDCRDALLFRRKEGVDEIAATLLR